MEAMQEIVVKVSRPIDVASALVKADGSHPALYESMDKTAENFKALADFFSVAATTARSLGAYDMHNAILKAWDDMNAQWQGDYGA